MTVVDGAIGTRNGVASAFKPRLEYQQGSQMAGLQRLYGSAVSKVAFRTMFALVCDFAASGVFYTTSITVSHHLQVFDHDFQTALMAYVKRWMTA